MSKIEKKLQDLSIVLLKSSKPVASYVNLIKSGNLVFISGQLPRKNGEIVTGKLGKDISIQDAKDAAMTCIVSTISVLKDEIGDLDLVKKCVKISVLVNSTENFTEHPIVANGASDLLLELFDTGHSRSAFGVSSLPLGACVEIESVFELV